MTYDEDGKQQIDGRLFNGPRTFSDQVKDFAAMLDQYANEVVAYEKAEGRVERKYCAEQLNTAKMRLVEAYAAALDFRAIAEQASIDNAVAKIAAQKEGRS